MSPPDHGRVDTGSLVSARALLGRSLALRDRTAGSLHDLLVDDRTWRLRFVVARTRRWVGGRLVALDHGHVDGLTPHRRRLRLDLHRRDLDDAPDARRVRPVSRQARLKLGRSHEHAPSPRDEGGVGAAALLADAASAAPLVLPDENDHPHLRSLRELLGYHVQAEDGAHGWLRDASLDPGRTPLLVRYLVLSPRRWLLPVPGDTVSTERITVVDAERKRIAVGLAGPPISHLRPPHLRPL